MLKLLYTKIDALIAKSFTDDLNCKGVQHFLAQFNLLLQFLMKYMYVQFLLYSSL
jgi:hypothetical protein